MQSLVAALVAFLISILLMPLIIRFATSRGWFDQVDDRKIHSGAIPRLGGVGMLLAFIAALVVVGVVGNLATEEFPIPYLWAVGLGALVCHLLGLVDDFTDLRARYKLILQLLVAIGLVILGFRFRVIILPFGSGVLELGLFSWPLTVLWIVGITNAVNLVDGMDGLAGSISGIAALVFGIFFIARGNLEAAAISFALVGAVAGFLVFNLPPAKIFMGDSGSLFLGYILAVLPLLGPAGGVVEIGLVSAVTTLLIPIYDTFAAIIRRTRAGVHFFLPDRSHVHHRLLDLGLSNRRSLLVICGAALLLGLASLTTLVLPAAPSFWIKMGSWLLLLAGFLVIHSRSARRD